MSRELAKWMRTAGIAITNEIVNLREEGIDNFLKKKMTKEDAKEITKLYFTGKCKEDFFESLVDTFYEVDNTFSDDMKQEITVLAGIIIFEMIERGKSKDIIELIEMYAQTYLFLKTFKSSRFYNGKPNIDIVISKNDVIYDKTKQDKNDFIDNIENQFRSFEKDFFINYFRIEAINGSCIRDTENSIELIDLLKYWITNRNEEMKEISNKVAKDIHNDFNRFGERY